MNNGYVYQLDAIPTVGFRDPILSYFSALQFSFDDARMLREGYKKARPGLFKIANFRRWMVLVVGSELLDDIRRAPDNVLSMVEPITEFLQPEYTLNLLNIKDDYHTDIIRSKLTRNIAATFNEVREELIMAMDDLIPTHDDGNVEWVKVPILETIQRVICRATNRIFVGAPLCRDYGYQNLNLTYAVNVIKFGLIIGLFPRPLKPIVSRMLSNLPSQIRQEIEFIRPIVEERFAKMEEYGEDWDDKPNDMLMWLMSEAKGVEKSLEGVARRLLVVNFAAIHSTSLAILYRLLANPEHLEPLREEVDAVIKEEGWTKAGIDKMYKVDSFLRETQRLDGLGTLAMSRLVLRPLKLSNGMTIPVGTLVAIPASATHRDEISYPNPDEFDGFRFAKLREDEGDTVTNRYQAVSTSNENVPYGLGRHTCPGRFFAANEIKALLAYILTTYDIKLEEGKEIPSDVCIGGMRFPRNTNLMFRARKK
ncbi:cytochrome P450 [Russula aff. rugulosa BPL654]|nr:cytochrome P450 [Russula aff. rugulosa BPL654]